MLDYARSKGGLFLIYDVDMLMFYGMLGCMLEQEIRVICPNLVCKIVCACMRCKTR